MTRGLTTTTQVHFKQGRGTRKVMKGGKAPVAAVSAVPRISRLMALAIRMQDLVRQGEVEDYANLARLARISAPASVRLWSCCSSRHTSEELSSARIGGIAAFSPWPPWGPRSSGCWRGCPVL